MKNATLMILAAAVLASRAAAAPAPAEDKRWLEPMATDTIPVQWDQRDVVSILSVTLTKAGVGEKPNAPSCQLILTSPSSFPTTSNIQNDPAGDSTDLVFAPATGCPSGTDCRAGNCCQVRVQVRDSANNEPTRNFLVCIRRQTLEP